MILWKMADKVLAVIVMKYHLFCRRRDSLVANRQGLQPDKLILHMSVVMTVDLDPSPAISQMSPR